MIEEPAEGEQPRQLAGDGGKVFRLGRPAKLIIVVTVVLSILLVVISGYIQKGLWMQQLGYSGIFWTLLDLRWELFCGAFVIAFLYVWINLRLAAGSGQTTRTITLPRQSPDGPPIGVQISPLFVKLAMAARRRFRRPELCGHVLWAMGSVSALSLWWVVWLDRSSLRGRCGVLRVPSALL